MLFVAVYDDVVSWNVAVVHNGMIIDQIQLICSAWIEF